MQTSGGRPLRTFGKDVMEEHRMYHRQDGKIVKQFDDLMDARRYGMPFVKARHDPY
jgi:hypothetical protein